MPLCDHPHDFPFPRTEAWGRRERDPDQQTPVAVETGIEDDLLRATTAKPQQRLIASVRRGVENRLKQFAQTTGSVSWSEAAIRSF